MIADLDCENDADRRHEPRLRFCWEAHVYGPNQPRGMIGRMVDLNSRSAAVLVDRSSPVVEGQPIELALTWPRVEQQQFEIIRDRRTGTVTRSDQYNPTLNRIVMEFDQPIAEHPAADNEYAVN